MDDPFGPLAFGARPALGAYYPDTRFIGLNTREQYFEQLLGRRPRSRDRTLLSLSGSILHHERVHWQIAHSLSWGLLRSQLVSMKTSLASIFFRSLSPEGIAAALRLHRKGVPPIRRNGQGDLEIMPHWSGTHHTLAEHAWLAGIFPFLIDRSEYRLASLRPPEFMLGVASQYLGRDFDPRAVAFSDDREFGERASTFKSWRREGDEGTIWNHAPFSVQSVEECLALIGQLNYIDAETSGARSTRGLIERFKLDILTAISDEADNAYGRCFKAAEKAFGENFDQLDRSLLGLICELALDPPLPFDIGGYAKDCSWSSFHPAHRFGRLLSAAVKLDWLRSRQLVEFDSSELANAESHLLAEAKLERATHVSIQAWLKGYGDDTTEWPSQELAWQHVQTSIDGRRLLETYPGLLFDFGRCANHQGPTAFLDLPYVVIEGRTNVLERGSEPAYRDAGRQIFNGHVARATDYFAFGRGKLEVVGLPTHVDDGFSIFIGRIHEFFNAAWGVDVPPLQVSLEKI